MTCDQMQQPPHGTEDGPNACAAALALKTRGNELFAAGAYEEALTAYEEAITAHEEAIRGASSITTGEEAKGAAVYFSNAAAACLKLGEHGLAAQYAQRATHLDASNEKALHRLGLALKALHQWAESLAAFKALSPTADRVEHIKECERQLRAIAFARAIHRDVFELNLKAIRALPADDSLSYGGPHLPDDAPITAAFAHDLAAWYVREEKRLPARILYRILYEAFCLFKGLPNVVHVPVPRPLDGQEGGEGSSEEEEGLVTICGDIHGQFFDLMHIFETNGLPREPTATEGGHTYIFNGDIVDRGAKSVEVATVMCALKVASPHAFHITRGNHESESVNRMHGFYEEIVRKYPGDDRMFSLFNQVLHALPLVHVVAGCVFVVHGGLPAAAEEVSLATIDAINRFCVPPSQTIMSQLLWSDPQDEPGYAPSHRGEGVLFGPDVTRRFLAANGLSRIIRSHVWEDGGYREQHDGRCVTIFSAPNYTGATSQAALINFTRAALDREAAFARAAPGAAMAPPLAYVQYDSAAFQGRAASGAGASPGGRNHRLAAGLGLHGMAY